MLDSFEYAPDLQVLGALTPLLIPIEKRLQLHTLTNGLVYRVFILQHTCACTVLLLVEIRSCQSVRLSSHYGTKLRPRKKFFWSVAMMIRVRDENGSRGNGKRRRGRGGGGGGMATFWMNTHIFFRAFEFSDFSKNVTPYMDQELCLCVV